MSLIPSKKTEGLIDGCFGPSEYCIVCNYELGFKEKMEGNRSHKYCHIKQEIINDNDKNRDSSNN